jgi:hypothetical protein
MQSEYRYIAGFRRPGDREPLAQAALNVDWRPAEECVRLAAFRRGAGLPAAMFAGRTAIEPIWDPQAGEPYLAGIRAGLELDGRHIGERLEVDYFASAAARSCAQLVRNGKLREKQEYRFVLYAFRQSARAAAASDESILTRKGALAALPVHQADFESLLSSSRGMGPLHPADIPAFVPARVLDELVDRTREAGAFKTGGILIGRVHRDPLDSETAFLTVTAQVPARACVEVLDETTFTPADWAAAAAAIRLRGQDEIYVGWWHSQPAYAFCEGCAPQRRESCPLQDPRGSFSNADCRLHRGAFPRAFSLALVATHTASGVWLGCFGWRKGRIVRRGLRLIDARKEYEPAGSAPAPAPAPGDLWHGSPCK